MSSAIEPTSISDGANQFTVLVTGANSGLGYAICCRMIDEFLHMRQGKQPRQTLKLLYTTRDLRKQADTRQRLEAHQKATQKRLLSSSSATSLPAIHIEGLLVDLVQLHTVKHLATQLLRRKQPLDAVIWNAGISGWTGLNYAQATWNIATDLVHASTYPTYSISDIGRQTAKQQEPPRSTPSSPAPALGQVFTANIFGHYLLTHYLSPLLPSSSRIIWTTSISAIPSTFSAEDIQGLRNPMAYEGSKRLTDYLVLTSELRSTSPYTTTFLPTPPNTPRPKMYLTHPGVIGTAIANQPWYLEIWMFLVFYIARLLGSPWHVVSAYKGAVSAVWAALSPDSQLPYREAIDGKGKWGSAVTADGSERVARTDVQGWGLSGRVGHIPDGSVRKNLPREWWETTEERRAEFEEVGRGIWRDLEGLRVLWEERLGPLEG